MAKKTSSMLYSMARLFGKMATHANDMETLLSGDPKKIAKRAARKTVYKGTNTLAKNINKMFK